MYKTNVYIKRLENTCVNKVRPSSDIFIYECCKKYASITDSDDIIKNFQFPKIIRPDGGRPYFADDINIHFSLSHSGSFCACAVSNCIVGLDLQIKDHLCLKKESVTRRFFHIDEQNFLSKIEISDEPSTPYSEFYDVWAAKESFVKYTGDGIGNNFSKFSVIRDGNFADTICGAFLRRILFQNNYSMYLCSEYACSVQLIEQT